MQELDGVSNAVNPELQPVEIKKKKLKFSVLGAIIALVCCIGYARSGDYTITDYHNKVAKVVYSGVTTEWNSFLQEIQNKDSEYSTLALHLEKKLAPAINKQIELVQKTSSPPFAGDYHRRLADNLKGISSSAKQFAALLNEGDDVAISAQFDVVASYINKLESEMLAFREKLMDEKGLMPEPQKK